MQPLMLVVEAENPRIADAARKAARVYATEMLKIHPVNGQRIIDELDDLEAVDSCCNAVLTLLTVNEQEDPDDLSVKTVMQLLERSTGLPGLFIRKAITRLRARGLVYLSEDRYVKLVPFREKEEEL